jgi:AraC-like DNA-binding protein
MPSKLKLEKLQNVVLENLRMRRGATVIGDILYGPRGACGPRIQQDFQLVVIHTGCLDLRLDDELIHVLPGHGVLLSPGHREHFLFSKQSETHHSWCAIAPRAIPQHLRREFQTHGGPVPFAGRMLRLLEMGRNARLTAVVEEPLQSGFYLGLGLALFCDFALAVRIGGDPNTAADALLAKLEQFIWEKHAQRLSLQDISRAVGVSRQHLLKVCRILGKPTPMSQLYAVRLEAATDLLRQTGLSIADIAEKCGFENIFHFSRRFKEAFGQSPAIWRKQLWQMPGSVGLSNKPRGVEA